MGRGVIADSEMTSLSSKIFAVGLNAWTPEGGLSAGSALGFILPPGLPRCVPALAAQLLPDLTASAPSKQRAGSSRPFPFQVCTICGILKACVLLSHSQTNRIEI